MPEEDRSRHGHPFHQNQPNTPRDVFKQIGIDIDDVDSIREAAADLYYLRRWRLNHQARASMTVTTIISAIASAIVGAASVVISNFIHTGKGTP